jgi:hypothetical protein
MINNECKVQYMKYQYNYILLNSQLHTILCEFIKYNLKPYLVWIQHIAVRNIYISHSFISHSLHWQQSNKHKGLTPSLIKTHFYCKISVTHPVPYQTVSFISFILACFDNPKTNTVLLQFNCEFPLTSLQVGE